MYTTYEGCQKFKEINNDRYYSDKEPSLPNEKIIKQLFYKTFGYEEKLNFLNKELNRGNQEYIENMNRFNLLIKEQNLWDKKYNETYNIRLGNYYFRNPSLIQQQVYNILVTSKYHNKQLAYDDKYFKYYSNQKKLEIIYLLPSDDILKEYFKKPNYDNLKWEECIKEEREKRKESIWNKLILISIYEQLLADKFGMIQTIFFQSYTWILNPVTGNYQWQKIKKVEFLREEFIAFNFDELNANQCIEYYVEKYKNKIMSDDSLKLNNRLSSIEDTMADISYSIDDIEPSRNTHIETLNNNDGGVINLLK